MGSTGSRRIRLGVATIDQTWMAGVIYLENVFRALGAFDAARRPETILLVSGSPSESSVRLSTLADHCVQMPAFDPSPPLRQRLQRRALSRLGLEESRSAFLRKQGIDVLFSSAIIGRGFRVPLVCWIPDFQHHHLPEMFTTREVKGRDEYFARISRYASRIILSSRDALHDMERWYPESVWKARAVPFVAQIPPESYVSDPAVISDYYGLPRSFVFLPNQFWKHKNHELVLEALALLKGTSRNVTVVCSGSVYDYRHPSYMGELLAKLSSAQLRERFVILGVVPRHHVFQLIRQSLAVLQPSLFEGWSTTVEEARSVGKSVLLSDIPVHREQNPPGASYFDPHDAEALARCLVRTAEEKTPGPDWEKEATARAQLVDRTARFAELFVDVVTDVVPNAVLTRRSGQ
jgi:glycosyltransferase involved in cell wall biosynthesis